MNKGGKVRDKKQFEEREVKTYLERLLNTHPASTSFGLFSSSIIVVEEYSCTNIEAPKLTRGS